MQVLMVFAPWFAAALRHRPNFDPTCTLASGCPKALTFQRLIIFAHQHGRPGQRPISFSMTGAGVFLSLPLWLLQLRSLPACLENASQPVQSGCKSEGCRAPPWKYSPMRTRWMVGLLWREAPFDPHRPLHPLRQPKLQSCCCAKAAWQWQVGPGRPQAEKVVADALAGWGLPKHGHSQQFGFDLNC